MLEVIPASRVHCWRSHRWAHLSSFSPHSETTFISYKDALDLTKIPQVPWVFCCLHWKGMPSYTPLYMVPADLTCMLLRAPTSLNKCFWECSWVTALFFHLETLSRTPSRTGANLGSGVVTVLLFSLQKFLVFNYTELSLLDGQISLLIFQKNIHFWMQETWHWPNQLNKIKRFF